MVRRSLVGRRFFLALGALLLVAELAFAVAFGVSPLTNLPTALQFVFFTFASLCFIIGGLADSLGGVEWYRFVGAGEIVWGLYVVLTGYLSILGAVGFTGGGSGGTLPAVVYLLSGLLFAFIGFDWFRGGRYFNLSA